MLKTSLMATALATATLASIGAMLLGGPVLAHHGWSSFDTRHAYYIEGTVTYVRWGNPHSEVTLRVEDTTLPEGLRQRPLPQGADEGIAHATLASARPYGGEHEEIHLTLAGPGWMERWGMDRALREGETVEVLGFLEAADSDDLRPVMFWTGDGQGVWQQLTSFPSDPEPAAQD